MTCSQAIRKPIMILSVPVMWIREDWRQQIEIADSAMRDLFYRFVFQVPKLGLRIMEVMQGNGKLTLSLEFESSDELEPEDMDDDTDGFWGNPPYDPFEG